MTKDVLLKISGLHYAMMEDTEESEPIEVITPASYYLKNGKHYVIYEEVVEGIPGTIKNKIRMTGDGVLEIMKSGIADAHMVFEKGKIHAFSYETPYGELSMGIFTRDMIFTEEENRMTIAVNYELDINGEKASDCDIHIEIKAALRIPFFILSLIYCSSFIL